MAMAKRIYVDDELTIDYYLTRRESESHLTWVLGLQWLSGHDFRVAEVPVNPAALRAISAELFRGAERLEEMDRS
jgi:hypothetical protein